MKLCGIEFENVWSASGALGFGLRDKYWFRKIWDFFGLHINEDNITFVAKTVTLNPREGNMLLNKKLEPKEWFPSCVIFQLLSHNGLNAVGLSNPGLESVLKIGNWQERKKPFFISIMSLEDTLEKRHEELKRMVDIIGEYKNKFTTSFGLQINWSCPNTGHNTKKLITESEKGLEIASILGLPLVPKYAIDSAPIQAVMELNRNPNCHAICVSNALKFGWKGINWKKVWGSDVSPLAHLGGGGLSGPKLLPPTCRWIAELRNAGFKKPINGGGGIFSCVDVQKYRKAGANSCFLGSAITLLPVWEVNKIIRYANNLKWR